MNNNPRIRQALFIVEKDKFYKFDVNHTITIKNLKKMIIAAANLGKNGLRIFHQGIEFTDHDEDSLATLFPDLQLVEFNVSVVYVSEEEREKNIKVRLGNYCSKHKYKYPYFYCYTCKKSVCSLCIQSSDHIGHNYIEKYDYLQSSQTLVDSIFHDLRDIISGANFNLKGSCDDLKQKITKELCPQLVEMVKKIEIKILDLITFFEDNEKVSFYNASQNVTLIKQHCTEGLDKLKSEIAIEDMMLDDEIFLTFDKKFKDIAIEKTKIYEDAKKIEEARENLNKLITSVENIYTEIYDFLQKHLVSNVYTEVKAKVRKSMVDVVSKDEVIARVLSDVKKRGKHLSGTKMSTEKAKTFSDTLKNLLKSEEKEQPKVLVAESVETITRQKSTIKPSVPPEEKNILVATVVPNSKQILVYNNASGTIFRKDVTFDPLHSINQFAENCSWVNYDGKIYISGGQIGNRIINTFLVYDCHLESLKRFEDMANSRHSHSMIHDRDHIYVVGGSTTSTEKFDLITKKWIKLTPMIVEDRLHPVCYVYNNFLYVFFGVTSNGTYLDSVERLNLKNLKSKWEIVSVSKKGVDLMMYGSGIVDSGNNQILFFGGKGKSGTRNDSISFDFSTMTFNSEPYTIDVGAYFQDSKFIDLGGGCFGQFSFNPEDPFLKIQFS